MGRERADPVREIPPRESGGGGLVTDPDALAGVTERLRGFVADVAAAASADGAVVALDGSLGPTVAATLAVDALGPDRVTALVTPAYLGQAVAAREAEIVADVLGVDHTRVHLHPLLAAFQTGIESAPGPADDLVATESALARLRAACVYYVANATDGVVVGAADRTALFTGTVVKHGDTAVDCLPLGDLYRTEVRALADALDLPEGVEATDAGGFAAPTPERDAASLDGHDRDRVLHELVDRGATPAVAADRLDLPPAAVRQVARWCTETEHKRRVPATPTTGPGRG
jgi:NAD+ synthase